VIEINSMPQKWNWELPNWPNFTFDKTQIDELEKLFLTKSGEFTGVIKFLPEEQLNQLRIDVISDETVKTSAIEGEYINRSSVQSSIQRGFGIKAKTEKIPLPEKRISEMMLCLYDTFTEPLSTKYLFKWHEILMQDQVRIQNVGQYRTHVDEMEIVSGRLDKPKIHFVAPPSTNLESEMSRFINWYNISGDQNSPYWLPPLARSALTHLYFVSIHPFEDGNGRIARALSEKTLFEYLHTASLIPLSIIISQNKKKYYDLLEENNKTLEVTNWIKYYGEIILQAQDFTLQKIYLIIQKTKILEKHKNVLNMRQIKVLNKIFETEPDGFDGGLSNKNYISISKTSRATATRDLNELVALNLLHKVGENRYARYYLNEQYPTPKQALETKLNVSDPVASNGVLDNNK
jgi:Fic family protein